MSTKKIPLKEFCELTGKKPYQVHYLFKIHKGLKCRVPGEKTSRVDMNEWEKILKTA